MESIIVTDENKVSKAVKQIISAGPDALHVICDFDRTITKAWSGREKIPSFVAILRHLHVLGEEYSKQSQQLFQHYHPIETSTTLSREVKTLAMDKWWEESSQLLVQYKLSMM